MNLRSHGIIATTLLVAMLLGSGCETTPVEDRWARADGSAFDAEAFKQNQLDCVTEIGAPPPQSSAPMVGTKNLVIDCMRRKGWVKR
jgi:hypothetical protein